MGDAIIALTTNVAINKSIAGEPGYVSSRRNGSTSKNDETPDGSSVEKESQSTRSKPSAFEDR